MVTNNYKLLFQQFIFDNYKNKMQKEIAEEFYNKYGVKYSPSYVSKIIRANNLSLYDKKHMKLHDKFIVDNYLKYPRSELLKKLNDKYGTNYTMQKIIKVAKRNNLHRTIYGNSGHIFNEEEKQWLYDNYDKYFTKTLVNKFNEKFNTNLTYSQLKNFKQHRKLKINIKSKKDDPWYYDNIICNKKSKRNIGYEFISSQGHVYIKVKRNINDNKKQSYVLKSRYVWEQHNGKIPNGYSIVHLDGNKKNNNISNLKMVKKYAQQLLNVQQINTNDSKINEIALQAIELQMRAKERKKEVF